MILGQVGPHFRMVFLPRRDSRYQDIRIWSFLERGSAGLALVQSGTTKLQGCLILLIFLAYLVNTFWVLISSVISFPRGVSVVPEMDLLAGPLNIPTDCELLVFLPELDAFFVFSMESAVSAFEIQGWCDEIILRWELGCVQWVQRVPLVTEVLVFAEILRSRSVTWILTRM